MIFDLEPWHYWIIVAIICFIFELSAPGFLLASIGIGALSGSLAAYSGLVFKYQLLFFAGTTFLVFIGIRPFYKKYLIKFDDKKKIGIQAYIGKECIVIENLSKTKTTGRVQIMGETWKAISINNDEFEVGEKAKIDKIDGITLFISKIIHGG